MKIGAIEANNGEKAFGFLEAAQTHGRFAVHLPLHIVQGAQEGPTLLVQAGVSGLEIEPAMILPQIVEGLDPSQLSGTLLVVPLLNTSGFEFEQINAVWDNKNLNALGRGREGGSVSEQLVHTYFNEVVAQADAVLEIRTGAQWSYHRYAGVFAEGAVDRSRNLAVALGLPQVLLGQPSDASIASEAARDGKTVVTAWIGGGPGLRDHREEDLERVQTAVLRAMKHLGMLAGEHEGASEQVLVIQQHTVLKPSGERGFTFMNKAKRGKLVEEGEALGIVRHPFEGNVIQEIRAPRQGIMLFAGASWPVLPEDETLAILGDLVEEVPAG